MKTFLSLCLLFVSFNAFSSDRVRDDETNAMRVAISAKMSVSRRVSTSHPGDQAGRLRAGRGGPEAITSEAGCGGIAIGNITPSMSNSHKHSTTVIINGNILNTGNEC